MGAETKAWSLGVDPGFGNTGVVLRLAGDNKVVGEACWLNDQSSDWEIRRAASICIPMMETVLAWIDKHDIRVLEVSLENPIYNGNPRTLMVQMALYTMIQVYIYDYLLPHLEELYLTLVNNKTSKKLLTQDGGADKDKMIKHSPWVGTKLTFSQKHTLADSYAHSLSSGRRELALHKMPQYAVGSNHEEP
jgi:Holliday junction resolvasome RuvABC endonuclease subunit